MTIIGGILKIRPGCHEEYKRRHDALWPELATAMRERDIHMVIYHFEDSLFMHATAPSQFAWEELNALPITTRWDEYMAEVLQTQAGGKPIFYVLPAVFTFGNYATKETPP